MPFAATMLNVGLSDHLLKHVRNVAIGSGDNSLWSEATSFLIYRGSYLRPKTTILSESQVPATAGTNVHTTLVPHAVPRERAHNA